MADEIDGWMNNLNLLYNALPYLLNAYLENMDGLNLSHLPNDNQNTPDTADVRSIFDLGHKNMQRC